MAEDPFDTRTDLDAQRVRVEALGEPGQRRFRLIALVGGETTVVWMEKQQLQALGIALDQMLDQLPDRGPELDTPDVPLPFDTETRRQFRVGRMELGYDDRNNRLVWVAHDIQDDDDDEEGTGRFSCRFTRAQARELSVDAASVVAAGRPRCTMCGAPMNPGHHVCPQQNGHLPLALDDTESEAESA